MSWKEFKKKKEQEEANNTNTSTKINTTTNGTSINTSQMSSWQKFKQKKETNNSSATTKSSWHEFKEKEEGITSKFYQDEEEKEDTWFKGSKLFDDGYHFGDISGTVLGTVGDVGLNLVKGVAGIGEGLGDAISYGIADIHDWTGNDARANEIRTRTQKNVIDSAFSPAENYLDEYSIFGEKSDSIAEGLGYVAGITAVGYFTGGVGVTATTFTNGMANGMSEALNNGASIGEAKMYGAISGAGEAISELAFGGLGKASQAMGLSKGALDDVVIGGLTKNIKNKMVKTVMQSGLKATGEGLEEIVSGLISAAGKRFTYMDDKKYSEIVKDEKLAEQFWMGALTSAISQGPSTIKSVRTGTDYISGRTNNEQKVYDNEVKTRTDKKIKQATLEQAYNEQIKAQENLGIKITEDLKTEIMQKVEKAYDTGTLKTTELSKKDVMKIQEEVEKDMQEGNISSENIMKTLGENRDISKDKLLMRSMYENEQKYNSYKVEQTDNDKVNVLMQSAADAGMNNTSKTRKKVELISKLIKDTNRQYKFVAPEQLKQMGYNENANGLINKSTGEILINARSDKGLQAIVGHETTHIFDSKNKEGEYSKEYQILQDMAIEYAKTKGIYDSKVQSITSTYGDLLVDESQIKEELTADLVGDFLFNDEKFIENLAVKDRNVFQKIYDYIKYIYKVATSGTDEAKALENLKYQFDKVYKTVSVESNGDVKYSIGGKEGIKNAIKKDTGFLKLERDYNKAQQMQKNGTDNETIRKSTGWFQDKNGDWKFEFSDKDMSVRNIRYKEGKIYKLGSVLEHDTLFLLYPQLKDYNVVFKNIKSNGSFKKAESLIIINKNNLKSKTIVEGTLIHEIQHAIQNIEGFAEGRSSNFKLAYYESLGEIEAADTKRRYLLEKQGNLDRNAVEPESSKTNPEHPKLKDYLANRNIVDKMKDGLYNYFKERMSNENNKENMELSDEETSKIVFQNRQYADKLSWNGLGSQRGRLISEQIDIENTSKESENNSGSFSLSKSHDNQGKSLSQEQEEYFKNSKSRDKDGKLKRLYHGTPYQFDIFNYSKLGENTSSLGAGFYFSDNKATGEEYARGNGNVKEVYVNITKPLSYGKTTMTKAEYKRLVEAVNKETNGSYLEDYGGINEALMEYEYGGDDIDLVNAIHNASGLTWEKTYDILRKETGFDGIISEQDFLNKGETIYVAFNSDQIKNIDNMTPTSNPNINLSLTNDIGIIGDDIAVKDLQREEKVTIEDEIINTAIEVPTVEDVITQTEEQKKQGMKDKAKKYLSRSKTKFINKIVNDFGTSKIANTKTLNSVVDRIREDIQQNGSLTKEKTDSYFNELYDNLVKIDSLYYDEYKEVKDNIRNTKLYISDSIKDNITDYNDFKKSNIGTLLMTSDSNNIAVDSYYQELSGVYPELFPEDILNPADQLSKISEVAKDITKVETNVAAYNDKYLGPDYRSWARASFDKDINDFTQDIKLANRYNMATDEKSKIGVDKEIVKYAYKQLPVAKKTYEKAISKELLTKEDRLQVNRLLNNEISPQDIPNGLNKKGIIKVAEAKLEYDSLQKAIKEYQTDIKSKRIEDARNDIGNLDLWKDKNIGFKYSRETPIRNIYDIAPKEIADNIVNKYFRSYIEVNEKKVIDAINGYNDRIKQLDIGTKNKYEIRYMQAQQDDGNIKKEIVTKKVSESALVQLLGENKITVDEVQKSGADVSKIQNAVNEFRNIYNELIEQINESMLDNGYAPVEYRKDYFPHFTEEKVDTLLGKAAKLLGIDITNREELPTDIAGQTYQFKPGRTWFGNILQRTIDVTDYDALKGFDKYIRGATDLIYHTGDIQNLRALSTAIRGTYNDVEIQNKIEEIKESTMSDLDKASAIQEVYNAAKDKSHLSKFIEWLDNYTNLLAGKKAINDRGAEKELNRQVYKTMQDVESRIAANAIGGNIGVSLTNFAPLSQAWGEIKTTNLINGIWQTMKASLGKDTSFASESQFVTRRRGTETLSETTINKLTKPLNNILQFADDFTSEVIVRSRYNQNLQEGMSAEVALEEADRYAAELMGDRGRGALPTQFSNKNPISKMINMFQVEVNNQWSYYLKDLPKNIRETANANKTQVVANTAMAYTKIMIGAYLTNELLGSIRGQSTRVLPDPIYIIAELLKGLTDDDDENDDDAVIETITEIAGNVPFISLPATLVADSLGLEVGDIGRVSISGAIPNISDITSDVFDVINGEKTLGEGAKSIGGELLDTVGASLALLYGGSQIKKTVKGLSLYSNDIPGSYTDSGDLRYTVEDDVGSKVQAAIFGAYANPYAQDYIDSGFKTISKDNIDEMVGLDMNSSEYRDYKKGLNKFNKTEEKLNYINSLDLTDSQKTLAANNINKNSKKTIDMSEYGNYSSYDEYKYARDNPEKYNLLTQITDYDNYVKYKDDIADIKKKYSTEAGYDSNERKSAVQSYINSLELNQYQKMMLEKMAGGYSIKDYQNYIYEYLETTNLSKSEKYAIWEELFN